MARQGECEIRQITIEWAELKRALRIASDNVKSWPSWKGTDKTSAKRDSAAVATQRQKKQKQQHAGA